MTQLTIDERPKVRVCSIDLCEGKHVANGHCRRHYGQVYKHGRVTHTGRPRTAPNEVVVKGKIAEILLYDSHGVEVARAVIDADMVGRVTGKKWRLNNGYAVTGERGDNHYRLHRLIADAPPDMFVDHINHDALDNRASNLRLCTPKQNSRNRRKLGVNFDKKQGKWRARINTDDGRLELGCFEDMEEAIVVYRLAAKEHYREFAYTGDDYIRPKKLREGIANVLRA
jgi:hypothetical protein